MYMKMEDLDQSRIAEVVDEVEAQTGYNFFPCELAGVIQLTIRKCEAKGKDTEYFYLLLRDELKDFLFRAHINAMWILNQRREEQCVKSAT